MFDVIVNPVGGSGRTLGAWHEVMAYFKNHRIDYRTHISNLDNDVIDIVREITSQGRDAYVILIGGDGS